ncbi:MAG TPA: APC family permease [Pyrinomonadaceae bacterium]|nr:APC family permease [Pyrinomonadaceae bacterium]
MIHEVTRKKTTPVVSRLRRDLGTLESYAALIGILIGAGIFKVTSQAWSYTGPSVILGYVILVPAILATSIPYAAFLSTPLGREPGGEYLHISRTLGGYRIAYLGAWLKIISYIGAGAYLADALAGYLLEFTHGFLAPERFHLPVAVAALVFFFGINVIGVRWFGRMQVLMCALKGLALVVLIVPGLFAIRAANYSPFVTHGFKGLAASLLPLFFAYAGFESLAQTAGEVKDSTRRLPMILLKGISATALIYLLMSIVAFGVLPGARLQSSSAPMAEVASVYLPAGATAFVTFGAVMAIMTALNGTLLVPSRLAILFVEDGLAPRWIGFINPRTATPIRGLLLTLLACLALLVSGQFVLALTIAVFALIVLYFLHSLVFLLLPRLRPNLYRQIDLAIPPWLLTASAVVSLIAMGSMIVVQIFQDIETLRAQTLRQRIAGHSLTSIELIVAWGLIGIAFYVIARWRRSQAGLQLGADEYAAELKVQE